MAAKLCAFIVWAVVAASAVFWGLRLSAGTLPVPLGAATAESTTAAQGDLLRLFGVAPVQSVAVVSVPAESTRFRLSGVVSPRVARAAASTSHNGVALIAVDGKPARAYRVGSRVDGDWVLQSVSLRSAMVGGAGGAEGFLLELPPLQAPATGTLPGLHAGTANAAGGMPFVPPAAPAAYVAPPPANEAIGQNINDAMPGNGPVPMSPPPQLPGRNNFNNLGGASSR